MKRSKSELVRQAPSSMPLRSGRDTSNARRATMSLKLVANTKPAVSLPAITTATLQQVDDDKLWVVLGGAVLMAERDPAVHPIVLQGALARGERVLVERREGGTLHVVGALRTQPTPGIDMAEEYTIKANRLRLEASDEVSFSAKAASVVLRAIGEVETYADRILSRAEGVHKIVGRMLRLN